jgi:hypothetical protein
VNVQHVKLADEIAKYDCAVAWHNLAHNRRGPGVGNRDVRFGPIADIGQFAVTRLDRPLDLLFHRFGDTNWCSPGKSFRGRLSVDTRT